MSKLGLNLNSFVKVKIKDRGIEKHVKDFNQEMPFRSQLSFNEFKNRADIDGFHEVQMWWVIDVFGNKGVGLDEYIDLNIIIDSQELEEVKEIQKGNIG